MFVIHKMSSALDRYARATAISFAALLSACCGPSHDDALRTREASLRAACPLGSTLSRATDVLKEQGALYSAVMDAGQCNHYFVEVLKKPEECAGGSHIDAEFRIAKDWTGFQTSLHVTYLFDPTDKLVTARYEPFYTWF